MLIESSLAQHLENPCKRKDRVSENGRDHKGELEGSNLTDIKDKKLAWEIGCAFRQFPVS